MGALFKDIASERRFRTRLSETMMDAATVYLNQSTHRLTTLFMAGSRPSDEETAAPCRKRSP
jgi:hypothetical protein